MPVRAIEPGRPQRTAGQWTEIMNHAKKNRRATSAASCQDLYSLELARSASHIASVLTPESRANAIAEVIEDFVIQYGETDLAVFLDMLADRLDKRGAAEAATAVTRAAQRAARRR